VILSYFARSFLVLSSTRCSALRDLPSFPTRRSSDLFGRVKASSLCSPLRGLDPPSTCRDVCSCRSDHDKRVNSRRRRTLQVTREIGRDTSELQSPYDLVCRLLLEKKKQQSIYNHITL